MVRLLVDRGIEPTVIEMNIETIRRLQGEGVRAVQGDLTQHEVREQAGSLILSSSGSAGLVEAIRSAREANPDMHIVARADFLGQEEALRRVGANEIITSEGEVALAITDSILRDLGGPRNSLRSSATS